MMRWDTILHQTGNFLQFLEQTPTTTQLTGSRKVKMVNLKVIAPGIQESSSTKAIIHIKRFPMVMVQVHEAPFPRSHSTMLKFLQFPSVRLVTQCLDKRSRT